MKVIIQIFILLIIIFIAAGASAFLLLNSPPQDISLNGVEFEIKDGSAASVVGKNLKQNKLIKSEFFFKLLTRATRLDRSLKAGYIKIIPTDKTTTIVKKILCAEFITITITIPEGYNLREINNALIEKGLATANDIDNFLKDPSSVSKVGLPDYGSIEGFLYPETYSFHKGVKVEKIYKKMVSLFYEKLAEIKPDYDKLSDKELFTKVTMASIIEREVRNVDEAPVVAGIFYNRLNVGMKLQSCATVQYILDKPKERLLEDDLLIDNPYNTYLNTGLPPGPISNPGFNSLNASFHPIKSNYLYFVVKDPNKGTHHFSEDYDEHLKAQARYKSIKGFF